MSEERNILIPMGGGRIALADENSYRMELYGRFQTSAVFALLIDAMHRVEDPDEFRETLLSTWKDKMTEERSEAFDGVKTIIDSMRENGEEVPAELEDDELEKQQEFFFGIIEEMICDLRAMLNSPKPGGAG